MTTPGEEELSLAPSSLEDQLGALVPAASQPLTARAAAAQTLKRRNVVAAWFGLPLVTLGFYHWYYWPRINAELGSVDPAIAINRFGVWAAMFPGALIVIPPFVSVYNTGKRIAAAQRTAGLGPSCSPALGVALMFVFFSTTLYYQSEINKIVDHT